MSLEENMMNPQLFTDLKTAREQKEKVTQELEKAKAIAQVGSTITNSDGYIVML